MDGEAIVAGFLAGTAVAVLVWWVAYQAAKPTIARIAGEQTAAAIRNHPIAGGAINAAGAGWVADVVSEAVRTTLERALP